MRKTLVYPHNSKNLQQNLNCLVKLKLCPFDKFRLICVQYTSMHLKISYMKHFSLEMTQVKPHDFRSS